MKRVVLTLAVVSTLIIGAEFGSIYDTRSGKIDYKISGGGNMMGMGTIKVVGKKRVIFDNYGKNYLEELVQVRKQSIMGKNDVQKEHKLTYRNGVVVYAVDFKHKKITRMVNNLIAVVNPKSNEPISKQIENNLKKFGAKKLGKDKVLGKSCDLWELMGIKQCLYKGIPLKIDSNIMGVKQSEVATKAQFDIKLNKDAFKLPNFPIYSGSMESMMSGVPPKKISRDKLEELDKKANEEALKTSSEVADFSKKLNQEVQKNGIDLNSKDMTPKQEKAIQNAVMNAMGGEKAILNQMKSQMLKAANVNALNGLKSCYKGANNLKAANGCVDKFNPKLGGEMDRFGSWNEAKRKESIKQIDDFIKAIPCIKTAKSMNDLDKCMP